VNDPYDPYAVQRELNAVRGEIRGSAQSLAAIGSKLIEALRQFDLRLDEANGRVSKVAERMAFGEAQLSELRSAIQITKVDVKENFQAVANVLTLLEHIGKEIIYQSNQFAEFRKEVRNALDQQSTLVERMGGKVAVQSDEFAEFRQDVRGAVDQQGGLVQRMAAQIAAHADGFAEFRVTLRSALDQQSALVQRIGGQATVQSGGLTEFRKDVQSALDQQSALVENMGQQMTIQSGELAGFRKDVRSALDQQSTNSTHSILGLQASLAALERRLDSLSEMVSLRLREHADPVTARSVPNSLDATRVSLEQAQQGDRHGDKPRDHGEPKLAPLRARLGYGLQRGELKVRTERPEADKAKAGLSADHIFGPHKRERLPET
jgi:hypothetical protein